MRILIFDSGPLINLSMNGFLPLLEKLKGKESRFIITDAVREEIYDRPLTIKQYELGALRLHELIKTGVLEFPEALGIDPGVLKRKSQELTDKANRMFKAGGNFIKQVSEAEMSCLALANELKSKNTEVMVVIDERTARMLVEKPENLSQLMSQHLHTSVIGVGKLSEVQGIPCIRSSELIYVAHKKGLLGLSDKKALEAALFATKFKGAAISWEEIEVLKRL